MALTNLDKDTTNRLFKMLSLNDSFDLEVIKKNYSSYSKLEILANQINYLQSQAEKIIEDCKLNDHLYNIPMNSKKIPGNFYYHYIFEDREILSIISPDEWNTYTKFLGKYLYNYDNIFYLQ